MTIALLALVSMAATAQMLEHRYEFDVWRYNIAQNEYVFCNTQSDNGNFHVYSSTHALIKTISLPVSAPVGNLLHISRKVFNSDDGVELVYAYGSKVLVLNETGTIIFERDSFMLAYFYTTTTGTKMLLRRLTAPTLSEVYSLPGTLPTGMSKPNPTGVDVEAAYPNPAISFVNLGYKLPEGQQSGEMQIMDAGGRVVDVVQVGKHFTSVQYDITRLAKGVYFYGLANGAKQRFVVQ